MFPNQNNNEREGTHIILNWKEHSRFFLSLHQDPTGNEGYSPLHKGSSGQQAATSGTRWPSSLNIVEFRSGLSFSGGLSIFVSGLTGNEGYCFLVLGRNRSIDGCFGNEVAVFIEHHGVPPCWLIKNCIFTEKEISSHQNQPNAPNNEKSCHFCLFASLHNCLFLREERPIRFTNRELGSYGEWHL